TDRGRPRTGRSDRVGGDDGRPPRHRRTTGPTAGAVAAGTTRGGGAAARPGPADGRDRRDPRRTRGDREVPRIARPETTARRNEPDREHRRRAVMNTFESDPLLDGLAGLTVDAPDSLLDRFAARWTAVATP